MPNAKRGDVEASARCRGPAIRAIGSQAARTGHRARVNSPPRYQSAPWTIDSALTKPCFPATILAFPSALPISSCAGILPIES